MLEEFLSHVYHHNRVVELVNSTNLLYRIGMTNYTQRIDQIMLGEEGVEAVVIAGNIESSIEAGITAAFAQYGVVIDYDRSEISNITDLLQFLAFWDTYEGSSAQTYPGLQDIRELGGNNVDILIELFERAGGNYGARLIDWVVSVSDSLIAKIQESFEDKPVVTDEPSTLPISALHDFRIFAVHFPDAGIVSHVKMGGAIGLSLQTMILDYENIWNTGNYKTTAVEVVGMALLSSIDRTDIRASLAQILEPVIGSTPAGQTMLREINSVFDKVLK